MDYEEKYKETLERARQIQNTPYTAHWDVMKELVEDLFPELAESKNERIRKHLIGVVELYYGKTDEQEKKDCLAWLENQGEKRSGCSLMEAWKDMRFEAYAQASGNRHESNYCDNTTKMFSLNDIDEIIEKLGEKFVEQKPAEWSEEDIKTLEGIVCILDGIRYYNTVDSKQEKPYQSEIDWLKTRFKSLRPQNTWKPSERQKEALLWCVIHLGGADKQTLGELLEELNKL